MPVANGFKSVHPMGHPISHSTHVGFNSPPICSLNGRELRSIVAWLAFPLRQSRAVGVAKVRALSASISVPPSRALSGVTKPPFVPRLLVGVGHCFTNSCGLGARPLANSGLRIVLRAIAAMGVCSHKPEPVPLMGGTNVGSSQHCPATVIPERGQVTEHSSESPSKEGWAVLHERESGSNLANDPRHVGPHAGSLSIDAGALSGNADVLAREAA